MRSKHQSLVDKSINAALAAIEIYNKPDFRYREDAFCVLMQNAWELLLKARILNENNGNLRSIEVWEPKLKKDGSNSKHKQPKLNRSGNPFTIGFQKAMNIVAGYTTDTIDDRCVANLNLLTEIRDNTVHFVNEDAGLSQRIQEVGAAALRNYMLAVQTWFKIDLDRYNFYLMPIAFHSPDAAIQSLRQSKRPDQVRKLLRQISQTEKDLPNAGENAFNVTMQIQLKWTRAKGSDAIPVVVEPGNPSAVPVTLRDEDYWARLWTYDDLVSQLRKRYKDFKQNGEFHKRRKPLMKKSEYCEPRYQNPIKKTGRKDFYNPKILKEFDKFYTRKSGG
ncbi:MAG: DUF3644 domain-containing protein [Pseudomonadota bacterium]